MDYIHHHNNVYTENTQSFTNVHTNDPLVQSGLAAKAYLRLTKLAERSNKDIRQVDRIQTRLQEEKSVRKI